MPKNAVSGAELKAIGYESFIGGLSIVNMVLLFVIRDPDIDLVVYIINDRAWMDRP